MAHNFSQVIKKASICQLILRFLMCICCSNEDMTEFKDQPKRYPDPQHPCCKLHSSQTIELYLENMQVQQECLVKSIPSRLRPQKSSTNVFQQSTLDKHFQVTTDFSQMSPIYARHLCTISAGYLKFSAGFYKSLSVGTVRKHAGPQLFGVFFDPFFRIN